MSELLFRLRCLVWAQMGRDELAVEAGDRGKDFWDQVVWNELIWDAWDSWQWAECNAFQSHNHSPWQRRANDLRVKKLERHRKKALKYFADRV